MKSGIYDTFIVNKFIAHRGYFDNDSPENSLLAFQKAIDKGYAIELDVQLLSDGTVVVFHDKQLSRMTGMDGYIRNIVKGDLENYKLLQTEEHIPTLNQVFELVNGQTGIIVDIKNTSSRVGILEKAVCKIIRDYQGDVAIQSMNPLTLEWFYKYAPNIMRGQVSYYFDNEYGKEISLLKRWLLKRMKLNKRSRPNYISYDYKRLPNKYVSKNKDIPTIAWVLRSQEDYRKISSCCDNIIFEGFSPKKINKE